MEQKTLKFEDMDAGNIFRIGIDKLVLDGFSVADIDFGKLIHEHEKIQIVSSQNKTKWRLPPSGTYVKEIMVADNSLFSDLVIGQCRHSEKLIEYAYLTLSVSLFKGANLENMSYTEYDAKIRETIAYIDEKYGIRLEAGSMKVRSMEVNTNLPLIRRFHEYDRVLQLFLSFHPGHLGPPLEYGKKTEEGRTFSRENSSMQIIYYDKLRQLRDRKGILVHGAPDILRMELRLKNGKKVSGAFGSRLWSDLDDGVIARYFHSQIHGVLKKKYMEWLDARKRELKKMIPTLRSRSPKKWHGDLMENVRNRSEKERVPYILDIGQVKSAFRSLPDKNNNSSRALKPFDRPNVTDDVYKNHDKKKAWEILNSLETSFTQTQMPPGPYAVPTKKRKSKPKKYPPELKKEIMDLYHEGESVSCISCEYGVPDSTIRKWIKKAESAENTGGEEIWNPYMEEQRRMALKIWKLEAKIAMLERAANMPASGRP